MRCRAFGQSPREGEANRDASRTKAPNEPDVPSTDGLQLKVKVDSGQSWLIITIVIRKIVDERVFHAVNAATIVIRLFNDLHDVHHLYLSKGCAETSPGTKEPI